VPALMMLHLYENRNPVNLNHMTETTPVLLGDYMVHLPTQIMRSPFIIDWRASSPPSSSPPRTARKRLPWTLEPGIQILELRVRAAWTEEQAAWTEEQEHHQEHQYCAHKVGTWNNSVALPNLCW